MSTANSYIAELREVTKRFEEKTVLDHVSLKVRSQERLVILGQSGSGKSHHPSPHPRDFDAGRGFCFFQAI